MLVNSVRETLWSVALPVTGIKKPACTSVVGAVEKDTFPYSLIYAPASVATLGGVHCVKTNNSSVFISPPHCSPGGPRKVLGMLTEGSYNDSLGEQRIIRCHSKSPPRSDGGSHGKGKMRRVLQRTAENRSAKGVSKDSRKSTDPYLLSALHC